jgi:predicted 2-oxoglutarate/Fe(II)-dependent dioxygenase YbiX
MKKKTKNVKSDDGLSPEWNEELVFDVQHPELGFALFQIKKSMYFGMRNSTVASYAIPIDKMVNGISSLILHDQNLENIDATLSVEIKIEDPKPEGVEVKGGTITIKDKLKELKGKLLALCEAIKNKIFALKQKGASSNVRKEHP